MIKHCIKCHVEINGKKNIYCEKCSYNTSSKKEICPFCKIKYCNSYGKVYQCKNINIFDDYFKMRGKIFKNL